MAGIKLSVNAKQNAKRLKEKEPLPLVTLVFLMAGVLGILLLYRSPAANDYQTWLVLPFGAVLCWGLWFSYNRSRLFFWCLVGALIVGFIAASYIFQDAVWLQGIHTFRMFFSDSGVETMDMTVSAMMLAVMAALALFGLECPGRSHALLYLATTALLLFAPLLDIKANIETAFLLILFQLAFWSISSVTRDNPRILLFTSGRLKMAGKSALALSIVLSVTFLAALPLVAANSGSFFDSVYQVEGFIYRSLDNLTGQAERLEKGGTINSGNNYPTGTPHIELYASRQPTEPIYLRGFAGGEYIGGGWTEADESGFLAYQSEERIFRLNSFCYDINSAVNLYQGTDPGITLSVVHLYGDYSIRYTPYISSFYADKYEWENISNENGWYAFLYDEERTKSVGYGYKYFEQKDIRDCLSQIATLCEEAVESNDETKADYYRAVANTYIELEAEYYQRAKAVYTQVPTYLVPKITELVRENPLTDLDEITAFIIYYLHSNAEYSLTPGWTPWGKDIADYFLFERKAGYCQHFALCATLMYRLYGVPARYATGYRADPSDFKEWYKDSYFADLSDADAHAWVEIFIEGYGWTPVEVTPSGSLQNSYLGLRGMRLDLIWQQNGWSSAGNLAAAQELQLSDQSDITDILSGMEISFDGNDILPFVIAGAVLLVLAALPLTVLIRRERLLKKYGKSSCRALFDRLLDTLHYGGVLTDSDGSEEDFAARLTEAVDGVSEEESRCFVEAVCRAAFGKTPPGEKERELAGRVCERAAKQVYDRLKPHRKLVFKYLRVYI